MRPVVPMRIPSSGPGASTDADRLEAWAESLGRRRGGTHGRGCLRFAFYGRVSTEDWQDPETSRARQLQQALMLVAGHGTIVAEFFDAGESRTLAWGAAPAGRRAGRPPWRIRAGAGRRS